MKEDLLARLYDNVPAAPRTEKGRGMASEERSGTDERPEKPCKHCDAEGDRHEVDCPVLLDEIAQKMPIG